MNAFLYRLMYWLGSTRWDTNKVPPEVEQAFQDENIPAGPALDLGCGTGTNTIFMALQGRRAIGIDFVPQAIAKARIKARQAGVLNQIQFFRADVTRLDKLNLPQCAFALDMGCFHGLSPVGQRRYVQELANVLIPGGFYMLYALDPPKKDRGAFGVTADRVQALFDPWFETERVQPCTFRERTSNWFWMKRKSAARE